MNTVRGITINELISKEAKNDIWDSYLWISSNTTSNRNYTIKG